MTAAAGARSTGQTSGLSESLEDYLEAILAIEGEKRAARPKDIARRLSVSPPAVTGALRNLASRGLVNHAPYDLVTLTEEGRRAAEEVRRRHDALRRFFTRLLQIDSGEADEVACHMEHALPLHVLERLVDFMDFVEGCPYRNITWSPDSGFGFRDLTPVSEGGHPSTEPDSAEGEE